MDPNGHSVALCAWWVGTCGCTIVIGGPAVSVSPLPRVKLSEDGCVCAPCMACIHIPVSVEPSPDTMPLHVPLTIGTLKLRAGPFKEKLAHGMPNRFASGLSTVAVRLPSAAACKCSLMWYGPSIPA